MHNQLVSALRASSGCGTTVSYIIIILHNTMYVMSLADYVYNINGGLAHCGPELLYHSIAVSMKLLYQYLL